MIIGLNRSWLKIWIKQFTPFPYNCLFIHTIVQLRSSLPILYLFLRPIVLPPAKDFPVSKLNPLHAMVNRILLMLEMPIAQIHVAVGGHEIPCVESVEVSQSALGNRWNRPKRSLQFILSSTLLPFPTHFPSPAESACCLFYL
jgi:hypothetical protein